MLAIITVAEPGAHGAVVTGIQGMGVNTPIAADVADATIGLASDWHIPNGMIFAIGILSMMLAIGVVVFTMFLGRTVRELGVVPKLHFSIAVLHTIDPICYTSLLFLFMIQMNIFQPGVLDQLVCQILFLFFCPVILSPVVLN
jgi:hypothetical protein